MDWQGIVFLIVAFYIWGKLERISKHCDKTPEKGMTPKEMMEYAKRSKEDLETWKKNFGNKIGIKK